MPGKVFYKDQAITTYAFLDQGSITTLCDKKKKLFKHLGIEGENVSIALTTVNKKDKFFKSQKANLSLSGLHNDEVVELQEVFSVDALTIKPNNSLTVNKLNAWLHLKRLHVPNLSTPVGIVNRNRQSRTVLDAG